MSHKMKIPTREQVERIRERYPKGTRVELISMEDTRKLPEGLKGTVWFVDDMANVHVHWENGSSLSLIPGEDQFRTLPPQETDQKEMSGEEDENEEHVSQHTMGQQML